MEIDISGLDRATVLAALYNGARPQQSGFAAYDPEPMDTEMAGGLLGGRNYFDYVQGRVMKVDLDGETLDPYLYDRDNGEGAAFMVIQSLRAGMPPDNEITRRLHKYGTKNALEEIREGIEGEPSPTMQQFFDLVDEHLAKI